ncbi:6-phosphogluconate dehydrogenase [Nematocida sp. AWRm77]|nr:6-phosphogluconate dehydrogenase [Nematocida sp. AWRm77]
MDLGVVGLGVMGENLVWNILDKGHTVCVYNRTSAKTDALLSKTASGSALKGCKTLEDMVASLCTPRKILLMVSAGAPVDALLGALAPLLAPEDTVIDGGNSNYRDTERRCRETEKKFCFVGCGISGGEEGARYGPSIMPGGDVRGWAAVQSLLQSISAKTAEGRPCCEWIGSEGSGHLVKTVHNGIEYAEMQIIADFYQILRGRLTPDAIADVFRSWGEQGTGGFLLETAQTVLRKKTEQGDISLINCIVDMSEQKGTGAWSVEESLAYKSPVPSIASAVTARISSSQKALREKSSALLCAGKDALESAAAGPGVSHEEMREAFLLCRALAYIQGFCLIESISREKGWDISLEALTRVWSNGCIIRSEFLQTLERMCKSTPMVHSKEFAEIARRGVDPLRRLVSYCALSGTSAPCLVSSLSEYDGLRTAQSSGNLIQALRDFFGAHTLLLEGSAEHVHIQWT